MTLISAIGGTGGIGKTWLALHWAHDHLERFPDGQLFVDLRGFSLDSTPLPPAVAVRGLLDALGVAPSRVPVDCRWHWASSPAAPRRIPTSRWPSSPRNYADWRWVRWTRTTPPPVEDSLGYIDHHTGEHERAVRHYQAALTPVRDRGHVSQTADSLEGLGHPLAALGQHDRARAVWREALELCRDQHRDDDVARVRAHLDGLDRAAE